MTISNGPVTWKGVYAIIAAGIGVAVSATWVVFWAIMQTHVASTHAGAVTQKEMEMLREDVREIKIDVREIRKEVSK